MPPNYQNGKVYAIRSHSTDKIYIGSTTQKLFKRLSSHVADYKRNHCVSSREILKFNDYYIELICDYSCERKEQLCAKEGEYIRQYKDKCVNKRIAGRSDKEYIEENKQQLLEKQKERYEENKQQLLEQMKQYRDNNKEHIAENKKQYRENNKEQIAEQKKIKYTCECGKTSTIGHKLRHERSMKHINFINSSN